MMAMHSQDTVEANHFEKDLSILVINEFVVDDWHQGLCQAICCHFCGWLVGELDASAGHLM